MKTTAIAITAILLATIPAWAMPETYTIQGSVIVYNRTRVNADRAYTNLVSTNAPFAVGEQCVVVGRGMTDLNSLSISVRDGDGKLIATGEMQNGYFQKADGFFACELTFRIDNIPKADFYSVKMGHRGVFDYSFDQMAQKDWTVKLVFGR